MNRNSGSVRMEGGDTVGRVGMNICSCFLLAMVVIPWIFFSLMMVKTNNVDGGKSNNTRAGSRSKNNIRVTITQTSRSEIRVPFTLEFKTLYVLSKLRKDNESSLIWGRESSPFNSSNGVRKASNNGKLLQSSSEFALGVGNEKLCATSVPDYEKTFICSKLLPSLDNIFFLETSCSFNQTSAKPNISALPLSEKQACSIYSAAHYNPSRKVILLFTCPVQKAFNWTVQWRILFDLPNFFFGRVDMEDLYANTSLSEFYHGPLSLSKYPTAHQADLMRMFVLYLYGGTYLDMDVISFKSLDDLGVNYLVSQGREKEDNEVYIVNGIWNLEPHHHFLKDYMINSISHYKPSSWSSIGPHQITNTVKSLCHFTNILDSTDVMDLPWCNIRVLPYNTFFSVPWWDSTILYDSNYWPEVDKMTNGSYGIHYWGSREGKYTLYIGSKQPIVKFAQQHCPPVYYNAGRTLS